MAGGFNQKGAGSAEGIHQRGCAIPAGELDQPGGGFPSGGKSPMAAR